MQKGDIVYYYRSERNRDDAIAHRFPEYKLDDGSVMRHMLMADFAINMRSNTILKCRTTIEEVMDNHMKMINRPEPSTGALEDMVREHEALRRWNEGENPKFSTGICESLTCGYGKCNDLGYFEFPLYPAEQYSFMCKQRRNNPELKDIVYGEQVNG